MSAIQACARYRAAASAALDGELPLDDGWEAHAILCAECSTFRADLERTRRDFARLAGAPVPDLWDRIAARAPRPRPWVPVLWRAAALLLGLAGTLTALWAIERARFAPRSSAHEHMPWAALAPLRDPPEEIRRAADTPEFQLLARLATPHEDER